LNDIPLSALFIALGILLLLSAFFSSSETGLMTLNRYRLRHLAKIGHGGAKRAEKLLQRPDRLIGMILIGNNFVNILASSLATIIAMRLGGEAGIAIGAGLLTLVLLIFAEVAPKTLAAMHPERIAFPAAYILGPLLTILYPVVWVINSLANALLRLLGVDTKNLSGDQSLSHEELRTVLHEAGGMIPKRHQKMLVSILDLNKVAVEDIMVPRNEITGIDLEDDLPEIVEQMSHSHHARLPVYEGDINNVIGVVNLRHVLHLLGREDFDKAMLRELLTAPYFIPEATPLTTQLLNFQREEERVAMVVDEYGDIQGLVTLEDILEEIVGEFTTDPYATSRDIHPQDDGSYLVDGGVNIRSLNRQMDWQLPEDGPKTLNGVITEYLEILPEPGTSVKINGYPIEVVQTSGNAVKTARINANLRAVPSKEVSEG